MTNEVPDRDQIVKTFGREAAEFITLAAGFGWRIISTAKGTSLTLIPYDNGPKRIHLSAKNRNRGALRKQIKTLVKYADPNSRDFVSDAIADDSLPQEAQELAKSLFMESGGHRIASGQAFQTEEEAFPEPEKPEPKPKPKKASVDEQARQRVTRERHIISERPAMMHQHIKGGTGRSYPSKTTVERRWSDGTTDYVCSVSGCSKEPSQNRLAFSGSHWAMHVRKGEAEPFDESEARASTVEDPSYTEPAYTRQRSEPTRRETLIKALQAVDLKSISVEDLADTVLAVLESTGIGGGSEPKELTDAEVLNRIRRLVDRGHYADQEQQILQRDQQIEDLMTYSERREQELEAAVLDAQQRATAAEEHLQALRDLVNQTAGG